MMLMLYDETPTEEAVDWFAVCPNSDSQYEAPLPTRLFDVLRLYTDEWDRAVVGKAIKNMKGNILFGLHVLMRTFPDNIVLEMCAREFAHRIPFRLLADIIALSHNGTGRKRLVFPDKRQKPVPSSLLKAFGLRGSESGWFHLLAENEDFVRSVGMNIKNEDWEFITMYDKATLFKSDKKQSTARHQGANQGALF